MARKINEYGRRNVSRPIYSIGETREIEMTPRPVCHANEKKPLQATSHPRLVPTAEDFANLFFCESSEEEEARATLATATIEDDTVPRYHASVPKRSRRRRVTFGGSISIAHHLEDACPASATWLSRHELELLRSSAQHSIHDMRNDVMGNSAEYKDRAKFRAKMVDMENEKDSSIRGLEHRIFRRKQTRHMLIEDVLKCQSHAAGLASFGHFMDAREKDALIAKVSLDRSGKAKSIALFDAREDYREAHEGDMPVSPPIKRRKKQVRHVSLH